MFVAFVHVLCSLRVKQPRLQSEKQHCSVPKADQKRSCAPEVRIPFLVSPFECSNASTGSPSELRFLYLCCWVML